MSEAGHSAPGEHGAAVQRRLHPLSWLFAIGGVARQLLLPILAYLLLGQRDSEWSVWLIGPLGLYALWAVLHTRSFNYQVLGSELLVREGLLDRTQRHIPFARIHNISQQSHFFHRLLGVTVLRLDSAAGGKPEAVMAVLSLAEAARLEAVLRGQRAEGRDEAAPAVSIQASQSAALGSDSARVLLTLPLREIVLLGLSSNGGMLLVGAFFGAVMPNDQARRLLGQWLSAPARALGRLFIDDMKDHRWLHLLMLGLSAVLTVLLLMRLLSVVLAVLRYHGFRLELQGERLLASHGLSTRVRAGARLPRLQRWELSASWLQRRLGRCRLAVSVAGDTAHQESEGLGPAGQFSEMAPLATPAQAQALLHLCLPGLNWRALSWQRLGRPSLRRLLYGQWRLALPLGLVLLLAAGLWRDWALPWWGIAVIAATLLTAGWLYARAWVAFSAYALTDDVLVFRSGVFTQRWVIVAASRVQTLRFSSNVLDRRLGLVHLQLDTQGGSKLHRALDIPCLERSQADALHQRLWRRV
ncbi:MAG: PH domain-containing protein [Paucibacter sp.]|nr:PH domain-containing protein [Roseateles sp.]